MAKVESKMLTAQVTGRRLKADELVAGSKAEEPFVAEKDGAIGLEVTIPAINPEQIKTVQDIGDHLVAAITELQSMLQRKGVFSCDRGTFDEQPFVKSIRISLSDIVSAANNGLKTVVGNGLIELLDEKYGKPSGPRGRKREVDTARFKSGSK